MATDIEYDIEVSKDKSTVKMTLNVPPRLKARDPIIEIKEQNAIQILEDRGLRGYLRIDDGNTYRLSNWDDVSRSAVWVFSNATQTTAKNTVEKDPVVQKTATAATTDKTATVRKPKTSNRAKKRRTTVTTKES